MFVILRLPVRERVALSHLQLRREDGQGFRGQEFRECHFGKGTAPLMSATEF